jgi:hypothetical protein
VVPLAMLACTALLLPLPVPVATVLLDSGGTGSAGIIPELLLTGAVGRVPRGTTGAGSEDPQCSPCLCSSQGGWQHMGVAPHGACCWRVRIVHDRAQSSPCRRRAATTRWTVGDMPQRSASTSAAGPPVGFDFWCVSLQHKLCKVGEESLLAALPCLQLTQSAPQLAVHCRHKEVFELRDCLPVELQGGDTRSNKANQH